MDPIYVVDMSEDLDSPAVRRARLRFELLMARRRAVDRGLRITIAVWTSSFIPTG